MPIIVDDNVNERLLGLETRIDELTKQNQGLAAERDSQKQKSINLDAQVDSLKKQIARLENVQANDPDKKRLQDENSKLQADIQRINKSLTERGQKADKDLQDKADELAKMKKDLQDKAKEVQKANDESANKQKELDQLHKTRTAPGDPGVWRFSAFYLLIVILLAVALPSIAGNILTSVFENIGLASIAAEESKAIRTSMGDLSGVMIFNFLLIIEIGIVGWWGVSKLTAKGRQSK
jgi:hypothetical protein